MNPNTTPPQNQTDAENRSANYAKRKKIVKILLIACVAVLVLYLAISLLDRVVDNWLADDDTTPQVPQDYEFWAVDEDLDIMQDEDYLQYDHRVSFYDPDSGATYSVEKSELETYEEYVRFFHSYFQTIIYGNEVEYSAHFAIDYEGEIPEDFTMQMVYDIYVQPHISSDGANTYIVNYKIHKNNGTFRRDIGSDMGRAQLFTLEQVNGELLIVDIRPYTSY